MSAPVRVDAANNAACGIVGCQGNILCSVEYVRRPSQEAAGLCGCATCRRRIADCEAPPACGPEDRFDDTVGKVAGFSLHASMAARAHGRKILERLCRYVSRPAVSEKRLSLTSGGNIRYDVNGFTNVVGARKIRSRNTRTLPTIPGRGSARLSVWFGRIKQAKSSRFRLLDYSAGCDWRSLWPRNGRVVSGGAGWFYSAKGVDTSIL